MSKSEPLRQAAASLKRNPAQWAAYESTGHCVVLAGPGSGKTKTLTAKIARLLSEEIEEPRGIACITYNNECARELESRLEALGVEPSRRVFIGTVHSFSLTQIVLPYAKVARLGLPDEVAVASRAERLTALDEALRRTIENPGSPQDWEFKLGNFRRSVLDRRSDAWRQNELAEVAEVYEGSLRRMGLVDFDDMPLLALRALDANPWLERALCAKYPVLLVDEYQDLGRALHKMVMRLCFRAGVRLFAVGDVDQSIYGFTGAHPELLQQLAARSDVQTVRLRLNYRSGADIVKAAGYALGEERDYESADGLPVGTVFFHELTGSSEQQARYWAEHLLPQALARHPTLQYGNLAVLYPAAFIGDAVADAARQRGVPTLRTDTNALYPRSSRLMQWLELCAQWCAVGWRIGDPRFKRVATEGRRICSESIYDEAGAVQFDRQLICTLWERRDLKNSLYTWLGDIRSKVLDPRVVGVRMLRDEIDVLDAFMKRVSPTSDRADMTLGHFAGLAGGNDSVNLSTLHSAKGREFDVVFMFGMDEGRLPRSGSRGPQLMEARRLFYVGFTRSKLEVHLMSTANRTSQFVEEVSVRLDAGAAD